MQLAGLGIGMEQGQVGPQFLLHRLVAGQLVAASAARTQLADSPRLAAPYSRPSSADQACGACSEFLGQAGSHSEAVYAQGAAQGGSSRPPQFRGRATPRPVNLDYRVHLAQRCVAPPTVPHP